MKLITQVFLLLILSSCIFGCSFLSAEWTYINRRGLPTSEPLSNKVKKHSGNHHYVDGLALVSIHVRYGYVDRQGKVVIKPIYEFATDFSEGLAAVAKDSSWMSKGTGWVYINKEGVVVLDPKASFALSFSEGLAPVMQGNNLDEPGYGYIDKQGKMVISRQFYSASPFSEGLAAVAVRDDSKPKPELQYGYIDTSGRFVIKPKFGLAGPFSEGKARVCISENSICKD